jgi:streptomycin 6-kinase
MTRDLALGARTLAQHLHLPTAASYTTQTMAASEGRAVVAYTFAANRQPSPVAKVVAKFYDDARGEHTAQVMRRIARILEEQDTQILKIPQLLFYDRRIHLMAQECAIGTPANMLTEGAHSTETLSLIGRATAALHTLPLPAPQITQLTQHMAELIRPHPLQLARELPHLRVQIEGLVIGLERRADRWRAHTPITPIHRDLHLRQLLRDGQRIWMLDWDLFSWGDPAIDVGNFLVYLETHVAQPQPLMDAFLAGYLETCDRAILSRAGIYTAFTYLRLACKRARLKRPGWQAAVESLLNLSSERLAAVGEPPHA